MPKHIEIQPPLIKCDLEGCGYTEQAVSIHDLRKYVDMPCPMCGSRLLSEEDYSLLDLLIAGARYVNLQIEPESIAKEKVVILIQSDGDGLVRSMTLKDPNQCQP